MLHGFFQRDTLVVCTDCYDCILNIHWWKTTNNKKRICWLAFLSLVVSVSIKWQSGIKLSMIISGIINVLLMHLANLMPYCVHTSPVHSSIFSMLHSLLLPNSRLSTSNPPSIYQIFCSLLSFVESDFTLTWAGQLPTISISVFISSLNDRSPWFSKFSASNSTWVVILSGDSSLSNKAIELQ